MDKLFYNCRNLLYLFDFDGTLVGSDNWFGYFKNIQLSLQSLLFNPNNLNIRWSILTSRPRIDNLLVKLICNHHKLNPQTIITSDTITWKFKNIEQEIQYKENVIKQLLNKKLEIKNIPSETNKIIYIDNNEQIVKILNRNKEHYSYLAMSVSDLITKDYIHTIL